jgi:hypothetical protein
MHQSITPDENLTLNEVKKHFDHWRATREKRCRTPDSLRAEVQSLFGRYPSIKIAKTLRINPSLFSIRHRSKSDISFVEAHSSIHNSERPESFLFDSSDEKSTCSIEIHRHHGGILKISELPISSLAKVINHFMGL